MGSHDWTSPAPGSPWPIGVWKVTAVIRQMLDGSTVNGMV
jgi:hypothetical protein